MAKRKARTWEGWVTMTNDGGEQNPMIFFPLSKFPTKPRPEAIRASVTTAPSTPTPTPRKPAK